MGKGAVLVSIPKTGTHLLVAILARCGYVTRGVGGMETQDALVAALMTQGVFSTLARDFRNLTEQQILRGVIAELAARILPPSAAALPICAPLKEYPVLAAHLAAIRSGDLCGTGLLLSVHDLWFEDFGGRFRGDWAINGEPRLMFNYRDPRDQLVSMVHFLRESSVAGVLGEIYGPILRSFETFEDQLAYAISCPGFPFREAYRRNAWMLRHPGVHKIRFEDLVGDQGGGSDAVRRQTIAGIAGFLGFPVDVDVVADGLFGSTRTFRRGQVGSWKTTFSEDICRAFAAEFGDVLELYGY